MKSNALEAAAEGVRAKIWLEPTYGLIVKFQVAEGTGPYETKYEIRSLSFSSPAASVFVLPTACAEASRAPVPMTTTQLILADTGGPVEDYAEATEPAPPASKGYCTVLLRVARAGTLEPV